MNKKHMQIIVRLTILILIIYVQHVEGSEKISVFRCDNKYVGINNIDLISIKGVYDSEGSPVHSINRGMTHLFISKKRIQISNELVSRLAINLSNMESWRKDKLSKPDGTVGLHVPSEDLLINRDGKWILARIYGSWIEFFDADLLLDGEEYKVFTRDSKKTTTLTEDSKIIMDFRSALESKDR
jgi:hypothetical protein